eukprot:CAMPEP_0171551776 /NCGR_PEP_ID=MMETSP0960-20121227/7921_1 /TAXON_ID=87120 /ORGANISM="Aurantiochytrium limacinum, Strain ATCCMYA-1381" /LENGTH=298 /DNA_ID=CAMNT_0012101087 /DNA_START=918 /DNA_END=1814 /DNA_ORIENTATION=-
MLPSDGPEHKSRRLNSGAVAGSCNLANSSNSAAAYNNSNSNSNNTNNYSLPGAGSAMNNSARAHSRRADGPRAARTSRDFADFLREYIDSSERSGQLDFDDNETNSSADRTNSTNSTTDYDGSRGPSSVGGDTDSTRTMPGEPSSVNDDGTLRRGSGRTFRGVHWNPARGCFVARLWRNGRCEILGEFSTETRAALAWDVKAESYFGPNFAEFNFSSEEDRARLWMAFTQQIPFEDLQNNTPSSSSGGGSSSSSSDGQSNSNGTNDDDGGDDDDDDDDGDRIINPKAYQGRYKLGSSE